jgi:hypothetical protein
MSMLNIEHKENSPEKLAAIAGKDTKYFLMAEEFNDVVIAVNGLENADALILAAAQTYAANLITQIINGAPADANTLKELNDKIIALQAIVGGTTPDGDSIVNTVTELLAVFAAFPEGVDVSALIGSKVAKADIYNALDCIISGKVLDARQGKALSDMIVALTAVVNGKEDTSNKSNNIEADKASITKYGSIAAWIFWLGTYFFSNINAKTTPVYADSLILGDSVDSNKTKKTTLQAIIDLFKTFFDTQYAAKSTDYSKIVYVNNVTPSTATIFDLSNPPVVNDNSLKSDVNNLYIGTDASTWVYNSTSSTYVTKTVTYNNSNFNLAGTSTDAGNNKTAPIERIGPVGVGPATAPNHAVTKAQADVTEIAYACSDEISNLTVGNLISFRMPFAMIVSQIRISVNEAPTTSSLVVDVKESGVSIFSTLLSIDATELTSVTAATPAVISDVNLADDALLTVSATQIGSGNAGKGLKILFKGKRS